MSFCDIQKFLFFKKCSCSSVNVNEWMSIFFSAILRFFPPFGSTRVSDALISVCVCVFFPPSLSCSFISISTVSPYFPDLKRQTPKFFMLMHTWNVLLVQLCWLCQNLVMKIPLSIVNSQHVGSKMMSEKRTGKQNSRHSHTQKRAGECKRRRNEPMFSKLHSHNQIRQRELNNKKTEHTHTSTHIWSHIHDPGNGNVCVQHVKQMHYLVGKHLRKIVQFNC